MKDERIVWRQRNVIATTRRYANPLFPRSDTKTVRRRRFGRWLLLVVLLLFAASIALVTAPAFRIAFVLVEGELYTGLGHSERVLHDYMRRKRLWLLPQQNYFVFSTAAARATVERSLAGNQALADLHISKKFPMTIVVQLTERIPHLIYVNGGKHFLVDRQGFIAAQFAATEKGKGDFPTFFDQTTRRAAPGMQVLDERYVAFLFDTQQALRQNSDIPITSFYAPVVSCPAPVEAQEQPPQPTNTNRATNSTNAAGIFTNQQKNTDHLVNAPARVATTNEGTPGVNTGNNTAAADRGVKPCNVQAQVLQQRELFVKTSEGWDIYFRSDDTVQNQVTRLVRILRELRLERTKLKYLDLRFGEHVVYKEKGG